MAGRALSIKGNSSEATVDGKSLLVGALLVGVAVLGFLYWDSRENTVFKAPGIELKKSPGS